MTRDQMPSPTPATPPITKAPAATLTVLQFVLGAILVLTLLIAPIAGIIGSVGSDSGSAAVTSSETTPGDGDDNDLADELATPVAVLVFGTLGFQAIQAGFPWVTSLRNRSTMKRDWRFTSNLPEDIFLGFILAIGCFVGAQVATFAMGKLVGLDDTDDASNTGILTDNEGSLWLIAILFMVTIGAPLAEELLFRGFLLRSLEKYFGAAFAIFSSSILFAIPHWQPDATWQESAVLLVALGAVGLVLAIGAVTTDRLGPPIVAHCFFNASATALTLL